MYVSRNSMDFWEIVPMFFAIMVGILVLLMLAYVFYQNKDKKIYLIIEEINKERTNFQESHCFGETYSAGKS